MNRLLDNVDSTNTQSEQIESELLSLINLPSTSHALIEANKQGADQGIGC